MMQNSLFKTLTTDHVQSRERAAYWRDLICDVFVQLDCGKVGDNFFGMMSDCSLGPLQLTRVRSVGHEALRTPQQIAKSAEEYFLVSLQLTGSALLEQDGRAAHLRPGDMAMYDSTRCYALRFEDAFEELVLKIPRDLVVDRIASPERLTATRISGDGAVGRVAFDFVRSVARQAGQLPSHTINRLSDSMLDVVSAAVGDTGTQGGAVTSTRTSQLLRIKAYIGEHLRNSELSREEVAAVHGLSVRYLNKLFADEGVSVTSWMREQRLQHIARDLRDPLLGGRSISEIAYGWGMNSMPHFSRIFKTRFGCSPRQYRAARSSIGA